MAERHVVKRIRTYIENRGGYTVKVHGDMFQAKTVDLFVCYRGVFIAIEAKRPGEQPSALQRHELERIRAAHGIAFAADNVDDVAAALNAIDQTTEGLPPDIWAEKIRIAREARLSGQQLRQGKSPVATKPVLRPGAYR